MAATPGADHVIGVDIGGTGIKGALVDLSAGKLAGKRVRLATPHPATPSAVAETVRQVLEQIDSDSPVGLPPVGRAGVVASAVHHRWRGQR